MDYSSLEVGHLGHIYEALLSLRLSVADRPLRYEQGADSYVPASGPGPADVTVGSLLWQTNKGGRKAGGVYYTPVSLVRHLVNHAVVPAYERHLENVRQTARTDPHRAATELLDFTVLDPACGSAHFLVQVVEALADRAVAFLAEVPLPAIREALDRLRAQAQGGAAVADVALLRRLILKHCVFGVDLSPMGAEVATLSLWLASFVPGLSLAYLGRNVVVGNALIGVGSAGSVVREGTWPAEALRDALAAASEAAARLADIDDRTPREVDASREADVEAQRATAGLRRLFDLWTAEGFGGGRRSCPRRGGRTGRDRRLQRGQRRDSREASRGARWRAPLPPLAAGVPAGVHRRTTRVRCRGGQPAVGGDHSRGALLLRPARTRNPRFARCRACSGRLGSLGRASRVASRAGG